MEMEADPDGLLSEEQEPLMSDAEFDAEVALASEGKGEFFETSLEEFKNGA